MALWWLQPGWTETTCTACGAKIWPEGDPDWGFCYPCFTAQLKVKQAIKTMEDEHQRQLEADENT